jgi:hypothetical protein
MAKSKILQTIYASAPSDIVMIPTLEIQTPTETIRLAHSYDDKYFIISGVEQKFEACSMQIALPEIGTSGNQTLTFGLGLVDGRAQRIIYDALENNIPSYLIYRSYIHTNTHEPAEILPAMEIIGGQFTGPLLTVECAYYDLLNSAWPRDRYTADKAPGVKHFN